MGWVHRNDKGQVDGWARWSATGHAEELPDDHPDVVAFLNRPEPAPRNLAVEVDELNRKLEALTPKTEAKP